MGKYENEAKKVIVLILKGGHSEELKAMQYVMDEAAMLSKHREQLHGAIADSLNSHSCSCHAHWELAEIARTISDEDNIRNQERQ